MASDLPRKLGLLDALSIVIGIVIGAGIFLVPNLVARELKSATLILAVWVFAGVISFFGALALNARRNCVSAAAKSPIDVASLPDLL